MREPKQNKPDPYNGFKSDVERRRALNFRVVGYTIVGVALALSGKLPNPDLLLQLAKNYLP